MLIAGDDDQALYAFKNASARYIRELGQDATYARFELPYCSRCTSVVVEAVNGVIVEAVANGNLDGRLDKRFECYLPDKQVDSDAHQKIIHARCTVERNNAKYVGRYITKQIEAISAEDIAESRSGGYPTVLVIGPNPFLERAYRVIQERFANAHLKMAAKSLIRPLDAYDGTPFFGPLVMRVLVGFRSFSIERIRRVSCSSTIGGVGSGCTRVASPPRVAALRRGC